MASEKKLTRAMRTQLGGAMALSLAQLLGCGGGASTDAPETAGTAGGEGETADLIHCYGAGSCSGHNDCATAENACAGQSECRSHGFVATSTKACGDLGGEASDEWSGETTVASLIHCLGVNQCAGHNDCATAENACAGQSECRGHGFVVVTTGACDHLGGEAE